MDVGKAVLCSQGSYCEVRMDHVAVPLHIMLAIKKGEDVV